MITFEKRSDLIKEILYKEHLTHWAAMHEAILLVGPKLSRAVSFAVLGSEPRASHMLGNHSPTELHPQP